MDSKNQLSQLDPKIKEAYDRVMNTTVHHNPTAPDNTNATVPNEHNPTTPPSTPPIAKLSPTPVQPAAASLTPTPQPVVTNNSLRREPEKIHIGGVPHGGTMQKKKSAVSPIVYIICGLIFLVIYIIFWLKFFNVPVPFLP